jgi:peroxiredoxin Q/BCP
MPTSPKPLHAGALHAGDLAPDFSCPDSDMALASLAEYKGKKHVVLYFYIRDDTPVCTAQAIEFSELDEAFAALDTVVMGVSRNDCISHATFRDKHGVAVRLLADKEGTICESYGVLQDKEVDGVKKRALVRSTFVIDKRGAIRHALYGVQPKGHAEEVLDLVKQLRD